MLYAFLSSPMCVTCSTHPIILDMICWIIFGDEYKLWSSSMCKFLHSPVASSLLGPNILLRSLSSETSIYILPLAWQTMFHTHKRNWQNYGFVYINLYIPDSRQEYKTLNWVVASTSWI
jgi:hypothetical protein